MRNFEIKAHLSSWEDGRRLAEQVATSRLGVLRQVDTYFHARQGRLKLREMDGLEAWLVWYERSDSKETRPSDYLLTRVVEPEILKRSLSGALGVRAVVEKTREVFLYDRTRIHLDRVNNLGDFLEFEAVLDSTHDDAWGRGQVEFLLDHFAPVLGATIPRSYVDLVLAKTT